MTEAEWLEGVELFRMMQLMANRLTGRQRRLFAVACCRRLWERFRSEAAQRMVRKAEQLADGIGDEDATWQLSLEAQGAMFDIVDSDQRLLIRAARHALICGQPDHALSAWEAVARLRRVVPNRTEEGARDQACHIPEWCEQVQLFRDIVGNPFRPVAFSPAWRTDTAVSLARTMYESRDFSAMPILADALQDAGCDNDDILSHCRGAGPHVRGCWVVDLVLGKE